MKFSSRTYYQHYITFESPAFVWSLISFEKCSSIWRRCFWAARGNTSPNTMIDWSTTETPSGRGPGAESSSATTRRRQEFYHAVSAWIRYIIALRDFGDTSLGGPKERARVVLDGAAARGAVGQQLVLDGRLLGVLEARAQDHGVVGVAERAQQRRRRRGLTVGQRELGHLRNMPLPLFI